MSMKTIYFTVLDTLADWEAGHVLAELGSGRYLKDPSLRYNVVLCGATLDTITTMGGLHLKPEARIGEVQPGKGDLLLMPGADTWLNPEQAPVIAKVREVLESHVTVGAICGATLGLANAGLLDNRPHTSNDPEVLKMFCPNYHGEQFYVNEPAVTDKNLITGSGLAPVEFACQIFRQLDVMSPATLDAWYNLFTTRKPECFYALMESLPDRSGTR
ncbi:MAG: glutamine amidotransferase [Methanomicrobiales archaeon]|nr:glutamine amidotransferase [Methanomicrobiales archaeon]